MWTFEPRMPMGLWWALVMLSVVALAAYAYAGAPGLSRARRLLILGLLATGLVGPLWVALNPVWIEPPPPDRSSPQLQVLVDGTLSMEVADAIPADPKSRWQYALELAKKVSEQRGMRVQLQAFDEELQPLPRQGGRANAATEADSRDAGTSGASAAGDPSTLPTMQTSGDTSPTSDAPADSSATATRWPRGHKTDLAHVVKDVIRSGGGSGQAILLISDGAHNVGSSGGVIAAAREAHSMDVPIYTVTVGSSVGAVNMGISARSPRMIAFPNNPLTINVRVDHSGLSGQTAQLSLVRDDTILQSQRVRLQNDTAIDVSFLVENVPEEPLQRYRILAETLSGEATDADNETTVMVQRLDHPIGVLLLEGKPYWDSKFLARNLTADPNLQLTSIVQLSSGRFLVQNHPRPVITPKKEAKESNAASDASEAMVEDAAANRESAAPAAPWQIERDAKSPLEEFERLDQYRLVILGRDADAYLTPAGIENLRQWISRRGGCVLCARGAPTNEIMTRLAEILPVRWSPGDEARFRTKVTPHGVDAAVFEPLMRDGGDPLAALPSLATNTVPTARSGLPQILVHSTSSDGSGKAIPVVTYQAYGRGQTIVVEGAGMWRWAFLPPQHAARDIIYPALWQSLIQWIISQQDLMPGQNVAIRSDRVSFITGDAVSATVLLDSAETLDAGDPTQQLNVLLDGPGLEISRRFSLVPSGMESHLYRVDFGSLPVGSYTATVVRGDADEPLAKTVLDVRDPWYEQLALDARPDLMRRLAEESGGAVLEPSEVEQVVARFQERIQQRRPAESRRVTLWDRPLVMLATLGAWMTTWIVRRRQGLT